MRTSEFDYDLPPELIAQTPAEPRDSARLLLLDRTGSRLEHRVFHELPDLPRPGGVLVANNSRVLPARPQGRRGGTGGAVEALLLHERGDDDVERPGAAGLAHPAGRDAPLRGRWPYGDGARSRQMHSPRLDPGAVAGLLGPLLGRQLRRPVGTVHAHGVRIRLCC